MNLLEQIEQRFNELITESTARMPQNKPANYANFCETEGYAIESTKSKKAYTEYVKNFNDTTINENELEEGISEVLDVITEQVHESVHRFAKEHTFSEKDSIKKTKERYVCLNGEDGEYTVEWGDHKGQLGKEDFTDEAKANMFFNGKKDALGLEEELDEISSGAGGATGPYMTPFAFSSKNDTTKDNRGTKISLNWGFEKAPGKKLHTIVNEGLDDKENLNETTYKQYANDPSMTAKAKLNTAIYQLNSKLFEVEKLIRHSTKLKTENNISPEYNKTISAKLLKINERIIRISNKLKEYGA